MCEPPEEIRRSIAADVGGIELMHARLNRTSVPPHMHDEYSISVTLRGGLAFDFRGSKHLAPSGIISCVAPGEVHNAYAPLGGSWEFINLLVPAAVVCDVLRDLEWRERLPDLPRRVVSDHELAQRFVALHRLLERDGDPLQRQSRCAWVLADFFHRHSTAHGPWKRMTGGENRAIARACDLMRACFSQPLSLEHLALHAGLSTFHFLRAFRAAVGVTPHVYLVQLRVLAAKRLLARGLSSAETALACGFCDQSHMTRQFRKVVFATPGQYRSTCSR